VEREEARSSGLERVSASDALTAEVLDLIQRQGLKAGARLPTVQALAARFAVAGPTVRESLRRLEAIGVLEMRHGSGVYVRNGERRAVLANPYQRDLDPDVLLNLLDARLLIEPHLAELTALRADARQLEELEELVRRGAELLDADEARLSVVNLGLHRAVARASGNAILAQVIDSLLELYEPEQRVILRLYDNRERDHAEHAEIVDAIRGRDGALAAELMSRHLHGVRSVVAARAVETRGKGRQRDMQRGGRST
jgi:GntR family transcriptional repressor for pyruvate dehydrogenase complex